MRNALRFAAAAVSGAAVALACAVPAVPAAGASAARFRGPDSGCSPAGVVPSYSRGSYDGLYGVSSLGSSDVWAVGRYINAKSQDQALIERWGGSSFAEVPSPDPEPNDLLYGVDAVTSADVWAVGATFPATVEVFSTLIEHWNGTAWSVLPSPPLSSGSGVLRAVAGDSPDDIWAVGTLLSGVTDTQASTLAEHWDGSTWQVVPTPDPGKFGNALASVAVLSPDDVWAVGSYYYTEFGTKNLVEHWNGRAWQVVPSPDVDIDDGLASVSAVSASDIWAVGDYFNNTSTGSQVLTLAEHFAGTRWAVAATPSPNLDNDLLAVQAVSGKDVWAVGGSGGPAPALVEHWNGTSWQVAKEPYQHGNANYLYALSASRSPGVWAAGSFGGSGSQTLAAHFCTP
jgi:hypothetical protein